MSTVVRRVVRWYPYVLRLSVAVLLATVLFAVAGQSAAAGVVLVLLVAFYAVVALPARRVVRTWWIRRTRRVPWASASATENVLYYWQSLCSSAGLGRRREDAEREELRRVRVDHQGAQISEGPSVFDMLRLVFGVAGLLRLGADYVEFPKIRSWKLDGSGLVLIVRRRAVKQDAMSLSDAGVVRYLEQAIRELIGGETRVTAKPQGADVVLRIREGDPLAQGVVLSKFPAFDAGTGTVAYGRDTEGEPAALKMSGLSGCVVAGLPGAGKTALMSVVLGPLLLSPAANVAVWDGKGGSDLAFVQRLADVYSVEDRDLKMVADALETRVEIMRDRLRTQKEARGSSNFWDEKLGATAEHPVCVTVVDEVQTYVGSGVAGQDKEKKKEVGRITEALIDLLKRGRSVGMFTIVMTQKPTSDALPTAIRDVADLRLALRLRTTESVRAALGDVPDDPDLSPLNFPTDMPGLALIDTGAEYRKVRAHFIPESVAERIIQEAADEYV
ncbi:FtsK/SpoIIIE domain-containing protein [Brevibacterium aurantiacum]|uniref:FtsK/SpoIIIE domain-containing protein n=1 Tax=Brevibacterium aurantiacum TaxID=273384 RepID=UPI000C779A18|nr:FtsK/SpoIIIE domain-containing protein [Brevibacterium aurantiacum]